MVNYFSQMPILHLATYCIIFVVDVTKLMFTVNDAHSTKVIFLLANISQLELAIKTAL